MKKSTIALLSVGAICIVAGGWYTIQNNSSTSSDQGVFATQSLRSQCINNEQEYISCRKEGMSEKFCLIKQSANRETGKSCLSNIPVYSKPVAYTAPVEDAHEIYTDRVTLMLSEKNTGRKTIVTDYNNAEESAIDYTANGLRQETIPFEKELMNYLNIALDAYSIKSIDNWSSYFASLDENVNPNIIDIIFTNETDIGTFVAELQSKIDQDVEILPVYKKTLYSTPNDPQANNLWYLKGGNGVHAYRAWDQFAERKLNYVKVGIVDDGFYVEHEDLKISSAVPAGVGGGHGTHVAGLVGALTNNNSGIASAARNSGNIQIKGYNYRFGQGDNDGSSNIMSLVAQAVQDGAKVINMSRGGGGYSSADAQIFQAAYNMGVVLIAAAGNEGASQPGYPARYPGVISVGATTSAGTLASFSNKGADLLSPGSSIISTCIGGGYCNHSGTSMASPLAASVAALLLSLQPSLSPDDIETILQSTTNPQGVINACNAVAQLLGNNPAVVCGDDTNSGGGIGEDCLGDSECQSGVCEEIIEGKCVSGQYGEKIACKGFTTKEQCLGFKLDVGTSTGGSNSGGGNSGGNITAGGNSGGGTSAGENPEAGTTAGSTTAGGTSAGGTSAGNGGGNLVSVCAWEETVVGGTCVASCGNNIKEGSEQCDDGNTINGDGCSATCEIEKVEDTLCEQMKNNKAAFDYNNDGFLNQNDVKILQDVILGILPASPTLDGKTGDLNNDKKFTAADIVLYNRQLQECFKSICGNGTREGTEQCDDGNTINGDGCSATCEFEKKILPYCGNNIIEDDEQCDGSGCAKGQTCTPAGNKNECTCEDGMINETTPTPPTRDDGKMDR